MVAQLPQQVFLLLVLVTGTTTGTVYRSELSDWTTASSTRRMGPSETRLSHATSLKRHDTPDGSSGHGRNSLDKTNGFIDDSLDIGITVTADPTTSRTIHLDPRLSNSDAKTMIHNRKKIETKYQNVDWSQEMMEANEGLVNLKEPENWRINEEFTNPSVNENQLIFTLSSKKSSTFRGNEETRTISSPSIIGKSIDNSVLLSSRRTREFTSSSSPALLTSFSNDKPTAADSRNSRSFQDSRINRAASITNSASALATRDYKLDKKFPKFLGKLLDEELSNEENYAVLVESAVEKVLETEDESSDVLDDTPLILQEMVRPYAKSDDQALSFPLDSSPIRIITSTIPSDVRALEISEKLPKKVDIIAPSADALPFVLTKEEQAERFSGHFDVPPPYFLSTTLMDQPLGDNTQKNSLSPSQYGRGKYVWLTSERISLPAATWPTTAVGFPKRYTRDTEEDQCEKFLITDDVKREFYSPNYPENYPPKTNCVRTLEAEKGMLLKLDFRDRFELESMTPVNDKVAECRFDYLEVRDGQYGFSNLLGIFCDKKFPPEIISKSRHLWLHFHSDDTIEYQGFKAVWSTIPRPTSGGVPPEQEPCIRHITNQSEAIVGIDDIVEEKKNAVKHKVALDCLWVITAPADSRMQLTFDTFKLEKPNDCSANFLDIFDQRTDIPSRIKNFCGSIAEAVHTSKNTMYIRFYLEPKAINGTFKSIITAVRDKGSTDKPCRDDEYDCDDATCIALSLKCNSRFNCRFQRDEDAALCGTTGDKFDSSRVIIILVIFSLIMFGMCFAFVFNCVRKLMRDHRIIREHIRQSRENRLDEIGRKTTPCPVSISRTDLRDRGSESPSIEIDSNKELIPASLMAHEYTKELVLEMRYGTKEMNDIHRSNNMSNATQERLQESSEELEMCDSSCQTRESLFEPRIPDATISSPAFSTFGYRRGSEAKNGISTNHRVTPQTDERHHPHHHHQHYHQQPRPPRQCSQLSYHSHASHSPPPTKHPVAEQCSVCISSMSRDGSVIICPKHYPIPAPPGWSIHEPPYPQIDSSNPTCPDGNGSTTYKRYHSPKPDRNPIVMKNHRQHRSPVYARKNTVGSGERYDSLICGSGRESSNAASNITTSNTTGSESQRSATPKYAQHDPCYRAEAVIEVDQKRPFSMESTKSAPDVIATH